MRLIGDLQLRCGHNVLPNCTRRAPPPPPTSLYRSLSQPNCLGQRVTPAYVGCLFDRLLGLLRGYERILLRGPLALLSARLPIVRAGRHL